MSLDTRPPEARARTAPGIRRPIAVLSAAALFAVLIAAAAWQGIPRFTLAPSVPRELPQEQITPPARSTGVPLPSGHQDSSWLAIAAIVFFTVIGLLIATALFFAVRALVRRLREWWNDRQTRVREGGDIDPQATNGMAVDAEPDAEIVRHGIGAALQSIRAQSEPGDAIVAAWVGLEETAADSGVARGISETPGEFTRRIIARRAVLTGEADALLSLYERVRFGGYVAAEADRERARELLLRIEEEWR